MAAPAPIPPAPGRMGYIGSVVVFGRLIRALSSSLVARQAINHPDVVDNTIDRTLYQLGAVEVDGDVAFPVVRGGSQGGAFLEFVWEAATSRDLNTGELVQSGDVVLEYSFQTIRTFKECRVNTLELRATAGDRVEGTLNFMGTKISESGSSPGLTDLSPARVLTWDDVVVTTTGDASFDTCIVKEFSATINNNLSRNYTFCPASELFASNISTGKRFINGSLGFQGFAPTAGAASGNSTKSSSTDTLTFNFGGFTKSFKNIIWEYQAIDINVGLITSTANWYAHAGTGKTPAFS